MNRRTKWVAGGTLAAIVIVAGSGLAIATGGKDSDTPLTGTALDKAAAAALAHTGGGTVNETEVGDDGAAYGVEIRLENGNVVEVALDETFAVIGSESDDDGTGEKVEADDD
jgi:hypothetical protein